MSAYLNAFVQTSVTLGNGPWINTTSYSTPLYVVAANQPTVPVYTVLQYPNPLDTALASVPLPASAQPAAGGDAELTVYQPSTDTLWEFWGLRQQLEPVHYVSVTAGGAGGSLPAGSYTYGVTALSSRGETPVITPKSVSVQNGAVVTVGWNSSLGADGYKVYRGPDAQHMRLIATIYHRTTTVYDAANRWVDNGTTQPGAAAPPSANTAATPGQWETKWGGRIQHVSTSPGYYRTLYDAQKNLIESSQWGATASSLPVAAGLITLSDLAAGHIDHAIALMVPKAKASTYVCPAQRTDGYDTAPNAVPEGAHFRLDPSLDLSRLQMSPITRMIAVAAQKYGLIVNDQTGATVGFRAEDPTPLMLQGQPNPYTRYFTNPATGKYEMPSVFLKAFPWSRLQLLAPPGSC